MEQKNNTESPEVKNKNSDKSVSLVNTPRLLIFPVLVVVQLVASTLGGIGFVSNNPPWLLLTGTLLWLVWFAGLFALALSTTDLIFIKVYPWLRKIATTAFIILILTGFAEIIFLTTGIWAQGYPRLFGELKRVFLYNDATALCHQASQNLLEGKNPYNNGNIVVAIQEFGGASDRITPRREGMLASVFPYPTKEQLNMAWEKALASPDLTTPEIETRMNYPAGAFEIPALFIWLGIGDIRWVYLIFTIPALIAVVWMAPQKLRWPFAGILLVGLTFWNSIGGGETGSLAFPFMLLGWVLIRKHPLPSAIFMGVAMSTKQTAFFLIPFYLILLLRTYGIKKSLAFTSIVAGIFFASNLPFIIRDPGLWIDSMGAPMSEDFFPVGAGLVTLVTSGLVQIKSPAIFTLMEGAVIGAGVVWYYLNCRRFPHTGPILAFLPLFFAWRSLWSYFFYIDFIVLATVVIDEYGRLQSDPNKLSIPVSVD